MRCLAARWAQPSRTGRRKERHMRPQIGNVLWMDQFPSHHFETVVETIVSLYLQGNRIISRFLSGAGLRPSTVATFTVVGMWLDVVFVLFILGPDIAVALEFRSGAVLYEDSFIHVCPAGF